MDRLCIILSIAALVMTACGGDDSGTTGQTADAGAASTSDAASSSGNDAAAAGPHSVGGTITGMTGTGLVLQDNGADDILVSANGTFKFSTKLAKGAPYAVTVKTQPANPAQTCTVANGTGTMAESDVTNVTITCAN